jgi:hypothetical protein
VREDQLLWLQEINHDQDNQVLWSQEITLAQANIFKQLFQDFTEAQTESAKSDLPKTVSSRPILLLNKNKQHTFPKIFLISSSSCSVLLLGCFIYNQLGNKLNVFTLPASSQSFPATRSEIPPQPAVINNIISTPDDDPFAAAVRIANQASGSGKVAVTSIQWLELAASWQQASDLMNKVPPKHIRYQEAQIRTKLYKHYSQAAQKEADKSKAE